MILFRNLLFVTTWEILLNRKFNEEMRGRVLCVYVCERERQTGRQTQRINEDFI